MEELRKTSTIRWRKTEYSEIENNDRNNNAQIKEQCRKNNENLIRTTGLNIHKSSKYRKVCGNSEKKIERIQLNIKHYSKTKNSEY
jgi:hypothetical protein